MPWLRSDTRQSSLISRWGFPLLIMASILVTWQSLMQGITLATILLLLFLLLLWMAFQRPRESHPDTGSISRLPAILIAGHLGMLLGTALDLGPFGLLTLAAWCNTRSELGIIELWNRMTIAPWGHLGMLLGANLGMWLILPLHSHASPIRPWWLYLLLCNLGMGSGLLAVMLWPPVFTTNLYAIAAQMMLHMLLAMTISMKIVDALWQGFCRSGRQHNRMGALVKP